MRWPWDREEAELQREVENHLHDLSAEYGRQGYSAMEARRMAEREFGGAEQVKEECRDHGQWAWLSAVRQDLGFGWRMIRRTPVVTAAAVLSLALGIGANTAIVSMIHTVMWKSLGVQQPERLSLVNFECEDFPRQLVKGAAGSMRKLDGVDVADFFSYPAFQALSAAANGRAQIAAYNFADAVSISYRGRATVAQERAVSGNFFQVMRPGIADGRLLSTHDDTPGAPPTVVLTHRFHEQFFGGDSGVVGRSMVIDNQPYLIAGVLAPEFKGLEPGDPTEIYVPMRHGFFVRNDKSNRSFFSDQKFWWVSMIARRAPGVTSLQLEALLDAAWPSTWSAELPKDKPRPRMRVEDGRTGLYLGRDEMERSLWVLGVLVGLVLLIACANIANLLLARAMARRREIALRVSLGCDRSRLMRQFLTESGLLATIAGAASIGVAYGTSRLLAGYLANHRSAPLEASLDPAMVICTLAMTFVTLLLFGVFPAWRSSRMDTALGLKETVGVMGVASHGKRWSPARLLVTAQVAFSLVLVAAAVLFTRNLRSIENSDPGFERRNLVMFGLRPGTSGYGEERLPQFYEALERRIEQVPGVHRAGLASMRPMNVGGWWEDVQKPGTSEKLSVAMNGVTPGFLEIMMPRLLAGQGFNRAMMRNGDKVAVIGESLAEKLQTGGPVVGSKMALADGPTPRYLQVVGVAPTIASNTIKERRFAVWVPFEWTSREATVIVRTTEAPSRMLPALRRAVAEIDANLPLVDPITMEEQISKILVRERMFATLCGAFGTLALLLAVIGLYGLVSFNASRRQSEIGLRVALGASRRNVIWLVAREGLQLTAAGLLLGAPAIWYGAPMIEKELSNMKAVDPATLAMTLVILLAVSVIAASIPAIRAARVDPASSLRQE